MHVKEIRRQRLEQLLALPRFGGEKKALATAIGKAPAQVSQWANSTRTITEDSARQIEARLKLPARWMDGEDATPAVRAMAAEEPAAAPYAPALPFSASTVAALRTLSAAELRQIERIVLAAMADDQAAGLGGAPTPLSDRKLASR